MLSHAATWTLGGEFVQLDGMLELGEVFHLQHGLQSRSDFDACGPGLHPRRAHRLDGEISDFSSSHAPRCTKHVEGISDGTAVVLSVGSIKS